LFGSESFESFVFQEHREDVIANDHACRRLIGELLIERVAEPGKKLDGLLKVFDRQIHKNFRSHVFFSLPRIIPDC
jgi:hypothetical protein